MALRRVFIDGVDAGRASVSGEQAHHLHRVVRLRIGESVELSDRTRLYLARVAASDANAVAFEIEEELPAPAPLPHIDVQLAIIKFPRWEWALEKAVELGAGSITPVAAARSDRKLVQAAPKRLERWRRIVVEAAQQCRRLAAPEVREMRSLEQAAEEKAELKILLDFEGASAWRVLEDCPRRPDSTVRILAGPEGGWEPSERLVAERSDYQAVRLSWNVLRTETAAVTALAALGVRLSLAEAL